MTTNLTHHRLKLIAICAACLALGLVASKCHGAEVTDTQAIRALYGEACGEKYDAKLAISGVMRARIAKGWGLRGIYGANSKQLAHIDPKAWHACVTAWNQSATNNTAPGCLHFGGKLDDSYFQKHNFQLVATYGSTRIYK